MRSTQRIYSIDNIYPIHVGKHIVRFIGVHLWRRPGPPVIGFGMGNIAYLLYTHFPFRFGRCGAFELDYFMVLWLKWMLVVSF